MKIKNFNDKDIFLAALNKVTNKFIKKKNFVELEHELFVLGFHKTKINNIILYFNLKYFNNIICLYEITLISNTKNNLNNKIFEKIILDYIIIN